MTFKGWFIPIQFYIFKYIHNLIDWDFHDFYYFVGSIQHKLRQYVSSYQHCLWLKNNVKYEKNVPIFFEKYVTEYFLSKIDVKDVESVYNYYIDKGKEIDFEELTEISEALLNNDFNLTQAAESLFLHKNTLIYKLKKLEEIFQIDIRGSFQGKILLILISHAIKEQSNKVQVGDWDEGVKYKTCTYRFKVITCDGTIKLESVYKCRSSLGRRSALCYRSIYRKCNAVMFAKNYEGQLLYGRAVYG